MDVWLIDNDEVPVLASPSLTAIENGTSLMCDLVPGGIQWPRATLARDVTPFGAGHTVQIPLRWAPGPIVLTAQVPDQPHCTTCPPGTGAADCCRGTLSGEACGFGCQAVLVWRTGCPTGHPVHSNQRVQIARVRFGARTQFVTGFGPALVQVELAVVEEPGYDPAAGACVGEGIVGPATEPITGQCLCICDDTGDQLEAA